MKTSFNVMISLRGKKDRAMLHVIWLRHCCREPQERLLKSDKKRLCSRSTHSVTQCQKVLFHPVGNFQKCALKGNFPGPKTSPVYRGMPQPQGKTTKDL